MDPVETGGQALGEDWKLRREVSLRRGDVDHRPVDELDKLAESLN